MLNKALAPDGPLHALTTREQFILCRGKQPVDPRTLQVGNAHDPAAWLAVGTALAAIQKNPEFGVGFVFTVEDPFYFLDIDGALRTDQTWSPITHALLASLPGAAVEVSQSGKGLHIFGQTTPLPHANKNSQFNLELYTSGRFVALTGTQARGNAGTDSTVALATVVSQYFPPDTPGTMADWTTEPVPGWAPLSTDEELLLKALATISAGATFGGRASFQDLWTANTDSLAIAYPSGDTLRPYDYSSADAALAQHLAFWTGNNCEHIECLMRISALVRDKWGREDYLKRTILRAVARQDTVYTAGIGTPTQVPLAPTPPIDPLAPTVTGPQLQTRTGYQFMAITQQASFFQGCVYIVNLHRVFCPNGALLKPEQFRAVYGGYLFALDSNNDKSTRNAWTAFTESQAICFPKANAACFKPQLPPGEIITVEGQSQVNIYVPANTRRVSGDATPFTNHLARLLPEPGDQAILMAYLAACVQYVGIKFQWAPLIQGCEGNGKTLLTRCVAAALGRQYVHYPKAADLDSRFNGWLLNKLLIGVEDIYVSENRRALMEVLKPMITAGDGLEVQFKGADQITVDICANMIFNSNHPDAIQKTRTDRRFAVFYTAQQKAGDLAKSGMDGDYFPKLYGWLLKQDGYAIVAHYLSTYPIPETLNPATTCIRAPRTSSTESAIAESLGTVEQEIINAVEENRPGFCGEWISSIALNELLEVKGLRKLIPLNRRRRILQSLGYDWHPALIRGRINNPIKDSGARPVLFIHDNSPQRWLAIADVLPVFQEAQKLVQISLPLGTAGN